MKMQGKVLKIIQQVRLAKNIEGDVTFSEESELTRWKAYLRSLWIKKKGEKLQGIRKAVGPDNIPVDLWRCIYVCESVYMYVYALPRG